MIIGSARSRSSNPLRRRIVSCSMVLSPAKGKYCLGYALRDSGQRRVPEPPERITGVILYNTHLKLLLEVKHKKNYFKTNNNAKKTLEIVNFNLYIL